MFSLPVKNACPSAANRTYIYSLRGAVEFVKRDWNDLLIMTMMIQFHSRKCIRCIIDCLRLTEFIIWGSIKATQMYLTFLYLMDAFEKAKIISFLEPKLKKAFNKHGRMV